MTGPGLREQLLLSETAKAADKKKTFADCLANNVATEPAMNTNGQEHYFTSYDDVSVHRLMVRDAARTEAYRRAVLENSHLFKDKVVMDVGAALGTAPSPG